MDTDYFLEVAEELPAVRNSLLTREHAAYCLALNSMIGRQERTVYNAMGPDISSVLLLTDASEIIGVDPNCPDIGNMVSYADKYWDLVDKKPIISPDAFWYMMEYNSAENYVPSEETTEIFLKDLNHRKKRGYWDVVMINRQGIERLMAIELKRLGVEQDSISATPQSGWLEFMWAYPGGEPMKRRLRYMSGTMLTISGKLGRVDCFYQKSLPTPGDTLKYIEKILPSLSPKASVMIGHLFDYDKTWESNKSFREDILRTLGDGFVPADVEEKADFLIDMLPEENPDDPYNNYGMKLHVFTRENKGMQ